MKYYLRAFKKFAIFNGRASKSEFWWFFLIHVIVMFLLNTLDVFSNPHSPERPLTMVYFLIAVIPYCALTCRRLHDTNKSGWWQLLQIVPLLGIIVLFMCARNSVDEGNRFDEK